MRYLRILETIDVYSAHDINSSIIGKLETNQIVNFNREKRRNGKNWFEIYFEADVVAYILKREGSFFKCRHVRLSDEVSEGCSIEYKNDKVRSPYELFKPFGQMSTLNGNILLRAVENRVENKIISLELEYDMANAHVEPFTFRKEDEFYITHEFFGKQFVFTEVDDFQGKKGVILKKTNSSSSEDTWVMPVSIVVMVVVIIGIILAFLQSGWFVISGLMIIPAVIVAIVLIFVIQLLIIVLKGIFHQIYKRF